MGEKRKTGNQDNLTFLSGSELIKEAKGTKDPADELRIIGAVIIHKKKPPNCGIHRLLEKDDKNDKIRS